MCSPTTRPGPAGCPAAFLSWTALVRRPCQPVETLGRVRPIPTTSLAPNSSSLSTRKERASLISEKVIELHHEGTILQRKAVRNRIVCLVPDHEKFATWHVLPPQTNIGGDLVGRRIVLNQRAKERLRLEP